MTANGLQLWEWELSGAVIETFKDLLEQSNGDKPALVITERGILQLIFDLRYLRDVLSGGRPAPPLSHTAEEPSAASRMMDPAVTAAVADRKRAFTKLEGQLQARTECSALIVLAILS